MPVNVRELPNCTISDKFDGTCEFYFSQVAIDALAKGFLSVDIKVIGKLPLISKFKASISAKAGVVDVQVSSHGSEVFFGDECKGIYFLKMWRKCLIHIGKRTTCTRMQIVCDNSDFVCGEDCLISNNVLVQGADQHGLVDLKTGAIYNSDKKITRLGNHVWLGRNCTITPGSSIGDGSVIGVGAIVTTAVPSMSIAVGVPAKVVKRDVTWSRSPSSLCDYSNKFVAQYNN